MRILLAAIGASVKWILNGFKNNFSYELYGEEYNQKVKLPRDSNIYIGMAVLVLLGILFSML